jgi:putative membrane protein
VTSAVRTRRDLMMDWGYADAGWMMAVATVVGVLLIVVTIALALSLYGGSSSRREGPQDTGGLSAAERVLEMRFARGEIDAEQLAQGKQALRH